MSRKCIVNGCDSVSQKGDPKHAFLRYACGRRRNEIVGVLSKYIQDYGHLEKIVIKKMR
jgi:hypothetical protein